MSIRENFLKIKEKVRIAAKKVSKKETDITLVVAGKNRTAEQLREVIEAGAEIIGENRVQELVKKYEKLIKSVPGTECSRRSWSQKNPVPGSLKSSILERNYKLEIKQKLKWHFIGHLQKNKVKQVIDKVAMIQSLDSLRLAEELNKRLKTLGKKMPVLIEVNTSREKNKFGILPEQTLDFITKVVKFKNLQIHGLMTMGRFIPNPQDSRPFFRTLLKLSEKITLKNFPNIQMKYLSMGMSHDFEIAIEEGANIVRVGRAIFEA